jgi:ADP-heptose:LPS heptosyltransferase
MADSVVPHDEKPPVSGCSTSPMRVVVVHQGALGDFLLMAPVLEGMCECCPNPRIDLWSKRAHFDLIANKPYIGSFHSCEGSELLPFFDRDLAKEAQVPSFFLDADAVLIFGQKSNRVLAATLAERLACPVRWIQSFPASDAHPSDSHFLPLHVGEFLKIQLRNLGWSVKDTLPHIEVGQDERAAVRQWLRQRGISEENKPVLIHPGSGGRKKIWPLERWWNLLWLLRSKPHQPVLMTLGPADEDLGSFAKEAEEELGVWLLAGISLPRLAAFLAESRLYVGSDSGVSHLAASVGAPTLVIFGPTDPEVWAPRGREVYVVKSRWEDSEATWRLDQGRGPEAKLESGVRRILERLIPCLT